jgi:hypothetical protein
MMASHRARRYPCWESPSTGGGYPDDRTVVDDTFEWFGRFVAGPRIAIPNGSIRYHEAYKPGCSCDNLPMRIGCSDVHPLICLSLQNGVLPGLYLLSGQLPSFLVIEQAIHIDERYVLTHGCEMTLREASVGDEFGCTCMRCFQEIRPGPTDSDRYRL